MDREEFVRIKDEGKALLTSGKISDAIEKYVSTLVFDSATSIELAIINVNIGICYQKLAKPLEAIQFIDNAIKLDPSYAKAHYRKIQCLNILNRFAESIALSQAMLKAHPADPDFISLFKQTNELIRSEQTNALSYSEYASELSSAIPEERDLKSILTKIQQRIEVKSDHTRIFLPGGFCERFLSEASRSNTYTQLTLSFFLANLSKILEDQPAFSLGEHSAGILAEMFNEAISKLTHEEIEALPLPERASSDNNTTKNQKSQQSSSSTTTTTPPPSKPQQSPAILLLLRLLTHCSIITTGPTIFQSIFTSKHQSKLLEKLYAHLSAILHKNVKYYIDSSTSPQTNTSTTSTNNVEILIGHLQKWIDLLTVSLRDSWERENPEESQLLRQLFITQLKLNPRYLDGVYFYRKPHLKLKDMVQVREILRGSYETIAQKLIENNVHNSLFTSYLRKPANFQLIDYLLDIYSLLLADPTFVKKVLADPAFQDFNIQLQRHMRSNVNHSAEHIIKYGLLLFKTNKDKQLPELISFLRIFSFTDIFTAILQLSDTKKISEALEFVGFMSCFDGFKVELIDSKAKWVERLTLKVDFQIYDQGLNWLIAVSNLCFDQLKDYEGKQKDKFGLDDAKLEEVKQFEAKYRPDDIKQAKEIFRYTDEFIKESNVATRLLESVNVIKHLSSFVVSQQTSQTSFTTTSASPLMFTYIAQLLSRLVTLTLDGTNPHKAMFDKQLLILAGRAINSSKISSNPNPSNDSEVSLIIQFAKYISKMLKNINPNIFSYTDLHVLIDASFRALQVSSHELLTFELLLSLVQLTSLGEQVTSKLINAATLSLLQNLLMEESNYYIVHATLEVINNICLNEKMMDRINSMTTLVKLVFAHFDACFGKLLDQNPMNITNSYDEPMKVISTIYNILAINASSEIFKRTAVGHLCTNPDTLVILLQKFAKRDGYMRMEFLYKFVFMTQSMRDSKKFTQVEKQMLSTIYNEIKEQYKQQQNGVIPKNDTRFEYMDYALS